MLNINFTKMNSLGNDYIFINCLEDRDLVEKVIPYISKLCEYNFGIGSDGIIFIESSQEYHCKMRVFNKDGTEGFMCGNGLRQLAKLLWDTSIIKEKTLFIEIGRSVVKIDIHLSEDGYMESAFVNIGELDFNPENIPFLSTTYAEENNIPFFDFQFEKEKLCFYVGTIGSPHAVCFIDYDVSLFSFCEVGQKIQQNTNMFPHGINVSFINIVFEKKISMRVWERGAGYTFACASAAAFAVGVGIKLGLLSANSFVEVELEKGSLYLAQNDTGAMIIKGSADLVFQGSILLK